jgi:glutamate dehydrogenase (NADP+)
MAEHHQLQLAGMTAVVSGSGNVAEFTARKLITMGVTVLTLSDRGGYLHKPTGLTAADIDTVATEKDAGKNLSDITIPGATYYAGTPWQMVAADAYFPCATQNEVTKADAEAMVNHAKLIVEGANMPLTAEALAVVRVSKIPFAPGKAANAGGVSVSGLEMIQNASHDVWPAEVVDAKLQAIMKRIHSLCVEHGTDANGHTDYVNGANIAGFKRVMGAMKRLGW